MPFRMIRQDCKMLISSMARQCGTYKITGTIDNLCFYRMEGKYYVRRKSSLSGKRVKRDAAFSQTMFYAGLLGKASKIASAFYKTIPKDDKVKGLYKQLTGIVMQLLKEGRNEKAIIGYLEYFLFGKTVINTVGKDPVTVKERKDHHFADALLEVIFAKPTILLSNQHVYTPGSVSLKNYGFV